MPKLTVDGIEIEVPAGTTVMRACELAGAEVPRFCYHDRLSIAGNCRMCLVEMEKSPKPIASCAMPVGEGMVIKTDTPGVRKARRGVMEFLLINHPLDCPICDQGGECDLQDQAMAYGFDRGRYAENKRAVVDKNLGPLIKTFMNRCIHCTRCIRFATEVAGVEELGAIGRGEHMEVGTYVEKALSSELSGNIVDLCPVGALTSKPYAFLARPWELRRTESIDVMDAVGSNIRIDSRSGAVLRILPRLNEDINEEWISDKTRHACDGLRKRRLDRPRVRRDGVLMEVEWAEAFAAIAAQTTRSSPEKMAALVGDQCDAEAIFALKQLMNALGVVHLDCRPDGAKIGGPRASYLFNSGIAGIERADALLIIGANPRWEAPIINARLRKRYLAGGFPIGLVGAPYELTYRYTHLGDSAGLLEEILQGHSSFSQILQAATHPMLILGMGALARADGAAILAVARAIAEKYGMAGQEPQQDQPWNGFNVLHTAAARVGALDLGFLPGAGGRDTDGILAGTESGALDFVYLLGVDELDMSRLGRAFVVYQGHHGDAGAARADVVLPGASYTEKSGSYVNTEGRVQQTRRANYPFGDAREDWTIIRALSAVLGRPLPFDDLAALRACMAEAAPVFAGDGMQPAPWGEFGQAGVIAPDALASPIRDFYQTDPICRASETMRRCSDLFVHGKQPYDAQEMAGVYG